MSRLGDLIKEKCLNRVEYKFLKDVSDMRRGTSATKNTLLSGKIPVVSGGREPSFYCNIYNRNGETITVAGSGAGAGFVKYWNEPIFVNDAFSVKGIDGITTTKYLYYCLTNLQEKIHNTKKGGGIPHVHISDIEYFKIPIPPIEIQNEIVQILDNFAELTAELTAELSNRKKQYEYYRDLLLNLDKNEERERVKWVLLGDVAMVGGGKRVIRNELDDAGRYPVYQNSLKPLGYYSKTNCNAGTYVICAGAAGDVGYSYDNFWAADDCAYFMCSEDLDNRYLYHVLMNSQTYLKSNVRKASIPRISRLSIEKLKIPLPSRSIQEKIVRILDSFDKLTTDISEGLPAEIEARKKQYEYYRDKILYFEELTVNA